ncbi:tetratricopeptide repeat protein [Natroniella sulfidigena]|uniref:tetratricopeptide repeat protein n=1 Tax=Natroniella sulfidigena TaxID=723921 RepID=UPI00200B997C|nr:tetratricopeptide repeat protein [Natroniella sulfidigena]MCK8816265.1 tetratricopeptide repeat protein [Natroniella sulfidigena]
MKKLACCLIILILSQGLVIARTKYEAEWQGVITARNKILEQEDDLEARYELAVAYANLGKIKEAHDIFDYLDEEIEDYETKIEEMTEDYQTQLVNKPDNVKLLNYLAFAYYISRDYQQAEDNFEKIVELDPKNIWSYNYLAVVNYELEDYDQAEKNLKYSLELEENQYTHFLLGANYHKQRNFFRALYHISRGRRAASLFLD